MRSIDSLAMGSVICGAVSFVLFALTFDVLSGLAAPYGLIVATVAGYSGVTLGRAALDRPGVRGGERKGRTEARIGIILALPAFPLFCTVLASLVALRMR